MKKILTALLASYALTSGQAPPGSVVPPPPPPPGTTAAATTAAATTAAATTAAAAGTTAARTTAAATTAAATTGGIATAPPPISTIAAPGTVPPGTVPPGTVPPGTVPPGTVPPEVPITTAAAATTTAPLSTAAQAPVSTAAPLSTAAPAPGTTARAATTTTTTVAPIITPAPTTSEPTTATPTTAAPTTAAPTIYINPYCPVGSGVGRPSGPGSQDQACITNFGVASIVNDWQGRLRCDQFSCCMCSQINCGFQGYPCETIQFGDSGAVGVQSINIQGGPQGFGFSRSNGAELECNGLEACKATTIRGDYLFKAQCGGDFACERSNVIIENPAPRMKTQCNGLMACLQANIEINVGVAPPEGSVCSPTYIPKLIELDTIEFNGQQSAQNAVVTVNNRGCDTVIIRKIECMNLNACPGITFNLIGDVRVMECDLMGIQNLNALPPQLRTCQLTAVGQPGLFPPQFPPQFVPQPNPNQFPNVPAPPLPPPPSNPGLPPPPLPPTNPGQFPGFPFPVQPFGLPLPPSHDQQLNCNPVQLCQNRQITIRPRQNFVLDCNTLGGCNGMDLTINVGTDPITFMPVTHIDAIKFVAPTTGATVNIFNVQGQYALPVDIGDIRCEETGSCSGLTINVGPNINVWTANIDCSKPFSCTACTINQGTISRPCDFQQPQQQLPIAGLPGQGIGGFPPQQFPQQPSPQQPQFPGQGPIF